MEDFTIQANPKALLSTATEIQSKATMIKSLFADISQRMKGTSAYWTGSAAELNRTLHQNQEDEMNAIISRFTQQANTLIQIAKNYIETSGEMVAVFEDLPGDVVS